MIKILVLDDEAGTCEQLSDFLSCRGYKVFGATTGEEALSILKKENPQILLLDIKMPEIDGIDVLREAKRQNPASRVIMITALRDEEKKAETIRLGADGYILKPFSYEKIEDLITKIADEVMSEEGKER